ncbi:hypothetical protein VA7868_04033 [Vibrio aerogenes CECT 7868]|uniref:1,4-alpha-glucan branching protein n=1 Tax=Vibrio aerogenes CECT 7868 TaxID=1216006 RepID=A0A1M6CJP6_9VIBR|nr:DUF2955 domain-containing protein [Vibrio aerogenes]SHI61199.1 hypothetical protein VA7868_04033 [Vibrio aerogenes CECT 7868]
MRLWDHPFSENDLRQCLRVAAGATLGFIFCKFFNFSFGVFFVIMPVMLLGLVPVLSGHAVRQLLASGVVTGLEIGLVGGLLGGHPGAMTIVVFILFMSKFYCMAKGPLFFFGVNCMLSLNIMLNFASYQVTDVSGYIVTNFTANLVGVAIAYLMYWLIPDAEPRAPLPRTAEPKGTHRVRHEVLLGSLVATVSFVVFQVFNLSDSMSAQSTTVLLLFRMNWNGALGYAQKRAMGVLLGVGYGLLAQFILYDRSGDFVLIILVLFIGAMLFSYLHIKEGAGSGVGFGGLTTMGILFGQYLTPNSDLMFSALYRISSILFAIVASLAVIFVVHRLLNSFEVTHYGE